MHKTITEALVDTSSTWTKGEHFPSWVNLDECELDQFYTSSTRAESLTKNVIKWLIENDDNITSQNDILFVEPSAGNGSFANFLPSDSVIMDIDPIPIADGDVKYKITKQDFLTWDATRNENIVAARNAGKKIVAIGNPPFGYRGWMALAFMNKIATFADYAAVILPMSFDSEGKGSPKYRVSGMHCVSSEEIHEEEFLSPNGSTRKFNVVWQIWEKGDNVKPDYSQVDARFEIKFICDLSYRCCGQAFKKKADIFVPQAYFPGTPMKLTDAWTDVLYESAYGVRALDATEKNAMIASLENADWNATSTSSTHGCRHVGMSEIKQILANAFGIDVPMQKC